MTQNLVRRGDIYYLRVMIGGRLHRRSTGFSNYDDAKRAAVEMENTIRQQRRGWITPDIPDLREWSIRWLKAYHPKSTIEGRMIRRFVEQHGHRPLNLLTRSDFEAHFRLLEREGRRLGGLERVRVSLAGMLQRAVDDGLLDKSPMRGIRRYRPQPRNRVLQPDEEPKLLAALSPLWRRFVRVTLLTGLRKSELLMARPCDLVSDGHMLKVRAEANKTRKSRLVPVVPEAAQLLDEQRRSRALGLDTDERRYWLMGTTAPLQALTKACELIEIPPVTVHDLRRTFGTRCAKQGMYPKHLQEIMGHKNIQITMRYYVHLDHLDLLDALLKVRI